MLTQIYKHIHIHILTQIYKLEHIHMLTTIYIYIHVFTTMYIYIHLLSTPGAGTCIKEKMMASIEVFKGANGSNGSTHAPQTAGGSADPSPDPFAALGSNFKK